MRRGITSNGLKIKPKPVHGTGSTPQRGVLELTHNWGTEDDPAFEYHDGNAQPQAFGHICFSVSNLDAAVRWFDENHVDFVKGPDQGKMKHVAFIKDADG